MGGDRDGDGTGMGTGKDGDKDRMRMEMGTRTGMEMGTDGTVAGWGQDGDHKRTGTGLGQGWGQERGQGPAGTEWDRRGTGWGHDGDRIGRQQRPAQDTQAHNPAPTLGQNPGVLGKPSLGFLQGWGGKLRHGAGGGCVSLTGIDEDQGAEEGHLTLREVQSAEALGEVEDGADELVAAWGEPLSQRVPSCPLRVPPLRVPSPTQGSEQLGAGVLALEEDGPVVGVEGSAHPHQHHLHGACHHPAGGWGQGWWHRDNRAPRCHCSGLGQCPHSTSPGGCHLSSGVGVALGDCHLPGATHGTVTSLMAPEQPIGTATP